MEELLGADVKQATRTSIPSAMSRSMVRNATVHGTGFKPCKPILVLICIRILLIIPTFPVTNRFELGATKGLLSLSRLTPTAVSSDRYQELLSCAGMLRR